MVMETIYNPSRLKTQIEDAYKLMKDAKKRGCDALIIEDGTNIVLYDIAMDSLYIYDMSIEKLSVMDVVKRRTDMHKFCIYTKLDEGEFRLDEIAEFFVSPKTRQLEIELKELYEPIEFNKNYRRR